MRTCTAFAKPDMTQHHPPASPLSPDLDHSAHDSAKNKGGIEAPDLLLPCDHRSLGPSQTHLLAGHAVPYPIARQDHEPILRGHFHRLQVWLCRDHLVRGGQARGSLVLEVADGPRQVEVAIHTPRLSDDEQAEGGGGGGQEEEKAEEGQTIVERKENEVLLPRKG